MLAEPPFLKKLPWQSHILVTDIGYTTYGFQVDQSNSNFKSN